jgi:hypothetical protein
MNYCTEAIVDIHGIKWYYPEICVDGGVFRAKNTYTNLTFPSGSFKHTTDNGVVYDLNPYSGHFYGIRKYTGLAPNLPYVVNITGRSGSSKAINIPTEIIGIEYNKNETDQTNDYSGFRLSGSTQQGGEFGKSVSSKADLLAIGCPYMSVTSGSTVYEDAGKVFLYRRNPRPTTTDWPLNNYKSEWTLEKELTLPSGMLGDYFVKEPIFINGLPIDFQGVQTSWFVGQDGRQFGYSVDLSVNENKKSLGENKQEILAVGGVGAKWNRTFDDDQPSGVSIGLMIFTDEFNYQYQLSQYRFLTYYDILNNLFGKDKVFNYFSDPRVKFDVKIMICVPTANTNESDPFFPDKPDFISLKRISRNIGYPISSTSIEDTLSGIKSSFLEAFPYDGNKLNSGIPPFLGLCFDGSYSMGGRESLEPAIDQFIDFYKDYSFSGGLRDFYNVRSSGVVYEYSTDGQDTNWINMSNLILNEILDTGRLVQDNQVRFFASNVGKFNENDKDFNIPPDSGGKVFIFEKESGSWNLIQTINSPNVTREYNDRFGHSVKISDDGELLVIGSPYINQAVSMYERKYDVRDYFYNYQLVDWVSNNRSDKYSKQLREYNSKPFKTINDRHALYLALDPEDKFQARLDNNVQEFQNVYTFDYSNMQPVGSWSFIPEEHAPTSRLGYSVATNENGTIVVAGAPTDSLNFYNDADVYYAHNTTYKGNLYRVGYSDPSGLLTGTVNSSWSSSLYAGSVHVFESRKYYPHNKVIEYGRFGNLHENISNNTADSGKFNYLSQIFSDKNFVKTEFEDPDIPMDVGLAFIITPAVSALSDEVLDNIKNWLAMGDRNLVLVANDPIWEANGIYGKSNDILNDLLSKLNSRMRIVPARNRYESLPSGYSSFNNIVPSMIPQGVTDTYVKRLPTRGSGVADIKIYYPYNEQMSCEEVVLCDPENGKAQLQSKCEMPLRNYGDLRAGWNDFCCKATPRGYFPIIYKKNWPFIFGSYVPDCDDEVFEPKPTKNQEPIPLLVASESVQQEIVYPAIPAQSGVEIIYETVNDGFRIYYEFGTPIGNTSNFSYSLESIQNTNYNYLEYNITARTNSSLFFKPLDELGGVLQCKANPKIDIVPYLSQETLSDKTYFALEYSYKDQLTSKIDIIPNLQIESQIKQGENDSNILFYQNLVSKSKNTFGGSNIAQLNWNGRESFVDGYENSLLQGALEAFNNLDLNVSILSNAYNVAWLPNINSELSEDNIRSLSEWLNLGDKRLIITCDNTLSSINAANKLCQNFGITLELLKKYDGENAVSSLGNFDINQSHQIGGNFFNNIKLARKLETFDVALSFYPFRLNQGAVPLAYVNYPVYDQVPKQYNNNTWDMNAGIVQINMPVLAGSGYRLFITTDSQNPSESQELVVNVENGSSIPNSPYPELGSLGIYELDSDRVLFDSKNIISSFPPVNCGGGTIFKDLQVGNTNNINIYISCAKPRLESDTQPKSVRLVGISGALIPIYEKVAVSTVNIPVGLSYYRLSDPIDERRETVDIIRPISTDNTKYCRTGCEFLGNQLIEDGPVVAAQELEIFSSFDAGFKRSRVTVITDSSILQGRYVTNENGTIPQDTYDFIRSLYPETEFFSENYGRQFNVYNKLISPERGSPAKYHIQAPYLRLNKNFGNYETVPTVGINKNESDYIPKYISRPKLPWVVEYETDEKKIAEMRNFFISGFLDKQVQHSCTSRISGVIDGTTYYDAPVAGGVPKILKDRGYDYLDLDKFPSGYVGDLFGYSLSVRGTNILIGSPLSAFNFNNITPWNSGLKLHLGQDGGAGSVYMFEKSSDNKWINSKKFRPQSLMGQLSGVGIYSDHFGHSLAMHDDIILIGSPNHSYGNVYVISYNDGSFARKNFNPQFDIPDLSVYDAGYSGVRDEYEIDNSYNKNMGAIYIYENKITDWENKAQSWEFVEKVVSYPYSPDNNNYAKGSGERFGRDIYLSRPYRSDSDYGIFAGCNFASGSIDNVGVVYAKDIMLRSQNPSIPNSGAWISAKVFGERDRNGNPVASLYFSNSGDSVRYYASGMVVTNDRGEIFLEVSGQDPSTKGFISHRPYIESIYGNYQYGKLINDTLNLHISGGNISPSSQLPLLISVENSAYVYNTLGLYSDVKAGDADSSLSGMPLFAQVSSGTPFESLGLYTSGIGSPSDNLNLSVRGK